MFLNKVYSELSDIKSAIASLTNKLTFVEYACDKHKSLSNEEKKLTYLEIKKISDKLDALFPPKKTTRPRKTKSKVVDNG